jgi:hypothetical protein
MASGSLRRCFGDFVRDGDLLRFRGLRRGLEAADFCEQGAGESSARLAAGVASPRSFFFEEDLDGMEIVFAPKQAEKGAVECIAMHGTEAVAGNCFSLTIHPALIFAAQSS